MAAQAVEQVVEQGQSLSNILPPLQQKVSDKDKALLQELCFGVLRTLSQLDWLINKLMARPMTGKQRTVHYLIMVGLYQLLYTRIPPHAALAETVEGAVAIKRPQLKGLINGVLRQFQRQQEELLAEFNASDARYLHPSWLLKRGAEDQPLSVDVNLSNTCYVVSSFSYVLLRLIRFCFFLPAAPDSIVIADSRCFAVVVKIVNIDHHPVSRS